MQGRGEMRKGGKWQMTAYARLLSSEPWSFKQKPSLPGRRPRRLTQAQFGRRPSSRPERPRRRAQSRLLLPDGALRLLEERVARPGIADGYFWRKLHHGWLAGRLNPSWRPVLRRFRGSGRDAAAPPLLQTGYQISGGRHGKAIPRQRPNGFLPGGHT